MKRSDAIRERERKATPGPWTREKPKRDEDGWAQGVAIAGTPGRQGVYANPPGGSFPSNDADFIAHNRADVPWLLARVESLEKALRHGVEWGERIAWDRLGWTEGEIAEAFQVERAALAELDEPEPDK